MVSYKSTRVVLSVILMSPDSHFRGLEVLMVFQQTSIKHISALQVFTCEVAFSKKSNCLQGIMDAGKQIIVIND